MEEKRARRRRDKARMKARARRTYPSNPPGMAERLADHIASCSCWMCGNPRKWFGEKTVQELREEERDLE